MFKKITGILLSALLILPFAGCDRGGETPSPTQDPKPPVFANFVDDFVLLSEAVVSSTLPPIATDGNYPSEVNGEGVLFGDKTVSISVKTDGAGVVVTVDGKTLSFYAENFMGANIVDINKDDNLHELAIYSEGASADPSVAFIRYDGTTLKNITHTYERETFTHTSNNLYGYLDADETDVLPTYGAMWTNQHGYVVTSFQQIGFTSPRLALGYFALENDTWVEYTIPAETEETYTVGNDFKAFFTPMDNPPVDYAHSSFVQNYDFDAMREFKKGQSIKLLGYGEMYSYYTFYVDIDGEKGDLAFWIGD